MSTQEMQLESAKKHLSDAAARLLAGDRTAIIEANAAIAEVRQITDEMHAGDAEVVKVQR